MAEGAHSASDVSEVEGAGHGAPRVDDAAVPRWVFLAIGVLVAVLAGVYWFTSYEDAGSVLLALTAVLGLWYGVFLWIHQRRALAGDEDGAAEPEYLPHASVWPLAIGLGTALVLNGFVLGIWVMVPGVGLTLLGIAGFIRQTRHRD